MTADETAEALRLCAAVYVASAERNRTDSGFWAVLRPKPADVDALKRLEELSLVDSLKRAGKRITTDAITTEFRGDPIQIEIVVPRSRVAFFAHDVADLLASPINRVTQPDVFYVADLNFLSSEDAETPDPVAGYFEALAFTQLLSEMADHRSEEPLGDVLIFLGKEGKLDIPLTYTVPDLRPLPEIDTFRTTLPERPHQDVKRTLFRSAVIQIAAEQLSHQRLPMLLRNYELLISKFSENYDLFVSGFSFETELARVHEAKRDYTLKLNGALNDIHAKLIAIPVAVVLVGGQMKADSSAAATLQNIVLLAGALVFALLMLFITANQRHSLRAIRQDYEARNGQLRAELPAHLYEKIGVVFGDLNNRYKLLKRMLFIVDIVVVLGFAFSVVVYFRLREAAPTPVSTPAPVPIPAPAPPAPVREPISKARERPGSGTPPVPAPTIPAQPK